MQNPEAEPAHAERNPENPEEQGEEGEGTSQGDSLMMRKMRLVMSRLWPCPLCKCWHISILLSLAVRSALIFGPCAGARAEGT